MDEQALTGLCEVGARFYDRGYAFGSTGNLSVRVGEQIWITPTGRSLKGLSPSDLACIDDKGTSCNDKCPSKEFPFHLAIYKTRTYAKAIVHLHSTYSVALSCLESLNAVEPLSAITPYYFMRVAPLAVLPYCRPGSPELAQVVATAAVSHRCLLLRNHGLIAFGSALEEAVDRAEELEETARLFFLLRGEAVCKLTNEEIEELRRFFPQGSSGPPTR